MTSRKIVISQQSHNRKSSAKDAANSPEQPKNTQRSEGDADSTTTSSDIAPTDDTLEGLADIARKCGSDISEKTPIQTDKKDHSIFDDRFLKGLTQQEQERDRLREPLTGEEQKLYDEWLQATKPVIDSMTGDLRVRLNIPNVGIELEIGQWTGPKLKDLVKGVMGLPPFAKRHEKEPRHVKITLLVDRSGSMEGDRIKYAALTVFTLLNTVFNLNEELEHLGFDPIEFESGLFTTEDKMDKELQISHETVAAKPNICRERLIFNIMSKITAGGGTDDVSALGRYVTRIIESPDRGTERSYRIFISIGDANLGTDANISDIQAIIKNAKEHDVHIFGVSAGDDAARKHMKQVYGADNSILPKSLSNLPGDIMKKINECIPMPRRTTIMSQYLALYLPWAPMLALGLNQAIKIAPKFFLSTDINSAVKTRALKQVEGYRHFYIERCGDKEYLVFKKDGVPERKWQRGAGGAHVPQVKVPDINTDEELMLQILNTQEEFGQDNLIELIGEWGLGKGEVLRAAAHLLNEEYYFVACNEDMEVEDLSETQSLGNVAAGVSGYEPSIIAQVQHSGGWVVLDERNKMPSKVLNELKSHLSGRNHVWNEKDAAGNTIKRTVSNHPRARIFGTLNPSGVTLDQAMQRRVKRIEFTWLPPQEEVQMQSAYAQWFAMDNGIEYSGAMKNDIESMIERLVRIATKERLIFAGYNAAQIGKIIANWRLLKDGDFKPANKRGEYLKRPPSPRVIKSVIKHMILYPKDLKQRPWSVVSSYFNYEAENDKLNTFSNVVTDFSAEGIVDQHSALPFKLDASSFTIDDGHLVVRPVSASGEDNEWDTVRVPLSPDAAIRKGELPERVKFWIRTEQNAFMLYRALQSVELGRDIIFVGEQETGKSKLAEAIAELLSGPELEIQPVTFSTSKEDITFTPHIGEDGAKAFQSGYKMQRLPRAMDDGNGRGRILIMEETTQGRPGVIGLLNEVAERGELPYPFSKKVIRKQAGFAIIHTINPPTKDYDVNAFSDEFLERHTIMGFRPLKPEQSYGYISDASKHDGLQVHPRLIGEAERDGSGNEILINGFPKYKGILGVEQYIRSLRAKDPGSFPRAPGVGTNMDFASAIRNNYEFYKSYYGLNGQQTLMKMFTEIFTMDGPAEKVRGWHTQIKAAFVYAGLWTDVAGKDAVDEYLRGEDVLVEGLPVLRKPCTGDNDLDRMLTYIQENTRGDRFREIQDIILKRCAELYDDTAWKSLGFSEKMERVYILKEAYQVAHAILSGRSAQMYDTEDWKKFELIKEGIVSNLLIKEHWPDEALTTEYTKEEFIKRYEGVAPCFNAQIDDLAGKLALFSGSGNYTDKIFHKLCGFLKARMSGTISHPAASIALRDLIILGAAKAALNVAANKSENEKIRLLIKEIAAYLKNSGVIGSSPNTSANDWVAEYSLKKIDEVATQKLKDILRQGFEPPALEALYRAILNLAVADAHYEDADICAHILGYIWRLAHAPPADIKIAERIAQVNARIEEVKAKIKGSSDYAGKIGRPSKETLTKITAAIPDIATLKTNLNNKNGYENWLIRYHAAIILGFIHTEESMNILIERLSKETDTNVLRAIRDSINYMRSQGIKPKDIPDIATLKTNLNNKNGNEDWNIRYHAAINLGCTHTEESMNILIERLSKETDTDVLRAIRDSINYIDAKLNKEIEPIGKAVEVSPVTISTPDIQRLQTELASLKEERDALERQWFVLVNKKTAIINDDPPKSTGIDSILHNDTAMSVELFCGRIPSALNEGRRYEIRYDSRVLGDSYRKLMGEYISILNARFPSSEFKLVKSSFDGDRLLETKCYMKNGASLIGEGVVRVLPEEGELKEYLIRVTAMINMTIAASSIADSESNEYEKLIQYITSQYGSLSVSGLVLTGDPAKDLSIIKNLFIVLPKTSRLNFDGQVLKNDMMLSLLRDA